MLKNDDMSRLIMIMSEMGQRPKSLAEEEGGSL